MRLIIYVTVYLNFDGMKTEGLDNQGMRDAALNN